MDDLISRQDAINELSYCQTYLFDSRDHDKKISLEDAEYTIERLPSAQKKGHWRNYEGTLTCSVCETEIDNGIMEYCCDDVPMFCPWCGADMRKEGKTNV